MTSPDTCSYEFTFESWAQQREHEFQLIEDAPSEWSCDRPAEADGLCLFHMPIDDKDDTAVVRKFVDDVTTLATETDTDAVAENRFLGAKFGDCPLSHQVVDGGNNRPIDLRFAHIAGDLQCDRFVTSHPIRLVGTVVTGEATFHRAQIGADLDLSGVVFGEGGDFTDAQFDKHIWGINTVFDSQTTFDRCTVEADLCLAGATINGNLRLASVKIGGYCCLSQIDCAGALVSEPKHIDAQVWCVRSEFETFDDDEEPNNLLRGGSIGDDVVVQESKFGDKLSFEDLDIDGKFVFEDTAVAGNWVDLTNCSVPAGKLGQPADGYVMYDFTDATIGNVRIQDVAGNGFERMYFRNTTFDDFDFGRHRSLLLRSNWRLHTVTDAPLTSASEQSGWAERVKSAVRTASQPFVWAVRSLTGRARPDSDTKELNETTYLKAKNGANQTGDNKAAAEFHRRELVFRRKGHADVAINGRPAARGDSTSVFDRLSAAGAWVANVGLDVTTGYGEKPHRVLLVSLLTILVFTFVFGAVTSLGLGDDRPLVDLFLLSFQSFITFVFGNPVGSDVSYAFSFVSAVEGLIGAFLVALSVFALTRSVYR